MRSLVLTRTFYQRFSRFINPLLATALIVFVVKTFVADTYRIPSDSMQPTLIDGDHVIGLKLGLMFSPPNRGEAVVIKRPDGLFYIKRMVAIYPDKIDIKTGNVIINDVEIKKQFGVDTSKYKYIDNDHAVYREFLGSSSYSVIYSGSKRPVDLLAPVKLGKQKMFILGDNRTNSIDSRQWGPISDKDVVAKPVFVWFSKDPNTGKIRWDRVGLIY